MRLTGVPDTPIKSAAWALILAALLWLGFIAVFPRAIPVLDELTGDWVWRLKPAVEERRIILVDIDEPSLREIGPWPWSRERLAELADRLAALDVALQVWDIVFASPASADERLAERLAAGNAVLSQVFALEPEASVESGHPAGALAWAACPTNIPRAHGFLANPAAFAFLPTGHITPVIGEDGILRHQPALICHAGKVYPALFIAALSRILEPGDIQLQQGSGLLAPHAWLTGPALGAKGIPLDAAGNVRIPWTLDSKALIGVSARDILAGTVPAEVLKNAWVVVGSTALGLNDRVATPRDTNVAGFVVHAQLLSGALDDRLPYVPARAETLAGLATVLAVLLVVAMGSLKRPSVFLIHAAGLGLIVIFFVVKAILLIHANLWFPWVGAALFVLLFALGFGLAEQARTRREKDRIYQHLASYLPGPVAAVLARKDPSDTLDVERASVTVLYADIRNFSAYCEQRPPDEAAAVLHAFFSMATRVIERFGGTVENFQGDAILAVWGVPGRDRGMAGGVESDAENALAAANDIVTKSSGILPQNPPDELSPLAVGIGLETGLAIVGSFGLARRRTHLALGRTVTAAARLQEMTVDLAHPILLGEGIAAVIGPHRLESQGIFLLEGLKIPCHVYAQPLQQNS